MHDPLFSVEGQVVLVSGGSREIGKAIAKGFAERRAEVILAGRTIESAQQTAAELSSDNNHAEGFWCDVCDSDQIDRLVEEVIAQQRPTTNERRAVRHEQSGDGADDESPRVGMGRSGSARERRMKCCSDVARECCPIPMRRYKGVVQNLRRFSKRPALLEHLNPVEQRLFCG